MSFFWEIEDLYLIRSDMLDFSPGRCVYDIGDFISDNYKVIKRLGEGTFGTVYKVEDLSGQVYALKLLKLWEVNPAEREILIKRFDMEFETGRIKSNYLVHSYCHGMVEGNPFIVMEFCPNGDLRSKNNLSSNRIAIIAKNILYGLRDLHQCGKIHRDLKPDNVLFRADNTAVLTDFGISGDQNKRMTERGWLGKPQQIFGTYAYMPPEQVRPPRGGKATVLPTTDIFSFGVMMYELIVGKLPFGILRDERDLMPYLNNGKDGVWDRNAVKKMSGEINWYKIIEACLVPDFQHRIQSIDEILTLFPNEIIDSVNKPVNDKGKLLLRIMQGEEYGKVYRVNDIIPCNKSIVTIGRYDGVTKNDISLVENHSSYISRKHCTIERNTFTQSWYIRDGQWEKNSTNNWRNSLNGTYVNSSEVSMMGRKLYDGEIISVGDIKMRVELY